MKNTWTILVAIALGCGSAEQTSTGAGGACGSSSEPAATSASSTVSSGAGGEPVDAGMDVGQPPPEDAKPACGSCNEALFGPDHLAGEHHLCIGSLAEGSWYAWINCACAPPPYVGSCYAACSGSAFCAGVYPAPGPWADPAQACQACLDAANPNGCAAQWLTCAKT